MKKTLFFFILMFSIFGLYALQPQSGEYVIYRDKTFLTDTWLGVLYYDANTYAATLYTPKENRRVSVLFSVNTKNGKMELAGQNVITKISIDDKAGVEAVNYLMQILPNFYAWGENAKKTSPNKEGRILRKSIKINSAHLGGDAKLEYASFVPLFGIEKITNEKKGELLELARIGRIPLSQGGDAEFFNFVLSFEATKKSQFTPDKKAKKTLKEFGSVKIKLDSQWSEVTDNMFFLGELAFLLVSNLEKKQNITQEELVKLFCLSDKNRIVNMNTVSVNGNPQNFVVTSEVYSTENQSVSFDKKLVVLSGNTYTIVGLTVLNGDYIKNQKYFDDLF